MTPWRWQCEGWNASRLAAHAAAQLCETRRQLRPQGLRAGARPRPRRGPSARFRGSTLHRRLLHKLYRVVALALRRVQQHGQLRVALEARIEVGGTRPSAARRQVQQLLRRVLVAREGDGAPDVDPDPAASRGVEPRRILQAPVFALADVLALKLAAAAVRHLRGARRRARSAGATAATRFAAARASRGRGTARARSRSAAAAPRQRAAPTRPPPTGTRRRASHGTWPRIRSVHRLEVGLSVARRTCASWRSDQLAEFFMDVSDAGTASFERGSMICLPNESS